MAQLTKEQAVKELVGIARGMLRRYHETACDAISEYGIDVDEQCEEVDVECERIAKRIDYLEGVVG